jgi:NAD(P)H-dependent FMN reductase
MPLNLAVILGTVRSDRVGPRVARYVLRALEQRGHRPTLIDPLEHRLPLLDKMYKEYPPGKAPEVLERLAAIIKSAEAFVIVSAEYNHSIPPALSNMLDHFLEEYFWRPSAIVCYSPGIFGGVRAAMQLRAMLCELGMPSIPSLLPFSKIHDALDADGKPKHEHIDKSAGKFLAELEWYANALKAARANGVPY